MTMAARLPERDAVAVTNDGRDRADVVRRAQRGDVDAFEELYRAHAGRVLSLCRRMVGDEARARELVQDIFVRAWEALPSFRGQSALGTWLHRLAVNLVLASMRRAGRDDERMVGADDELGAVDSLADRVDSQIDLDAALLLLAPGARVVFVLHDIEGYSHEEIAQMTGIAAGTARAQLWRARRALMRRLDR
jgi:RNA polymerase sigma-70 factor (ECF subfamily)